MCMLLGDRKLLLLSSRQHTLRRHRTHLVSALNFPGRLLIPPSVYNQGMLSLSFPWASV